MNTSNLLFIVLPLLIIWELFWKGIALWGSAKNNHKYWFIFLLLINSLGIVPLIYLNFFSKKTKI